MIRLFSQKEPFVTEAGLITPKNRNLYWAFGLVAGSWGICLLICGVVGLNSYIGGGQIEVESPKLSQFETETEFRNFVSSNQSGSGAMVKMGGVEVGMDMMPAELSTQSFNESAQRYSETNVQLKGIDEPDIVKTDGKNLYISSDRTFYPVRMMPGPDVVTESIAPYFPEYRPTTEIVEAFPYSDIKKVASIEAQGNLLVTDDRLVVFEAGKITGFNITNEANPEEKWSMSLESSQAVETARLVDGKMVLITKTAVYSNSPCPIPLWKVDGLEKTVACTEVWRPDQIISADGVYTVTQLNPGDGQIEASVSFVGSNQETVVYVSDQAVYLTFTNAASWTELMSQALLTQDSTLLDEATKKQLIKVLELDISQAAKVVEIEQILSGFKMGLSDDERMKWEAEMTNWVDEYVDNNKREIEQTIITKVDIESMSIAASGEVPGRLLNQFSLDEHDNYLRVATTVGGRSLGNAKSANDVYVLDTDLKQIGKVIDLGKEERIYAVRFIGDRGFVVTFRETDPLYVLDLSNPQSPQVAGELKIPGYSSYLHLIKEHLLVGIGKEGGQVKVSLFDVSDSSDPVEVDKYLLPDYWTDILSTHLAFLQDDRHEIFFMPASGGGYIFGYQDNKLKLEKAVSGNEIVRAVYIDDYLYLVGNRQISIVSETDWATVKTFEW